LALLNSLLMLVYIILVLYSAISDARTLRIPNWISLTLLVAFLGIAVSVAMPLETIAWHLAAGVVTLVFCFGLFAFGYFGGGDAKLMATCALWVGWPHLLKFVFAVLLVGGGLSVLVLLLRKGLGFWPDWLVKSADGLFTPNKAIPYGIAIAVGAMIVVPIMDTLPPDWRSLYNVLVG